MERSASSKSVVAEFFADGYRVSGTYISEKRLLADTVYDPTTDYLNIEDAYLSPVIDPTIISAHYRLALIKKSRLDFVLTVTTRDGIRRDQHYAHGMHTYSVFLTVPFFEITGNLRTNLRIFKPRTYLGTTSGDTITLLNVTARCIFNTNVIYQGGAAQINRAKITFFGEVTE